MGDLLVSPRLQGMFDGDDDVVLNNMHPTCMLIISGDRPGLMGRLLGLTSSDDLISVTMLFDMGCIKDVLQGTHVTEVVILMDDEEVTRRPIDASWVQSSDLVLDDGQQRLTFSAARTNT